jgi:hypothetical protein
MPMEGQWRRANTPLYKLTRRERVAAMIIGALTLVAVLALLLAGSGTSRPAPGPGCIRATVPGVMGALEVNACGERARNLCDKRRGETDPGSQSIENACREAGISS